MHTPTPTQIPTQPPTGDGGRTLVQEWLAEAEATGVQTHYDGKHHHPRTTWRASLEVRVPIRKSRTKTHYARAIEISEDGLGFFCRTSIPVFTPVEVLLDGQRTGVMVTAMECIQTLGGYQVNAEFRFEQAARATQGLAKAG